MDFLTYVSQTKVNMLYDQLPRRKKLPPARQTTLRAGIPNIASLERTAADDELVGIYQKLKAVTKHLSKSGEVGDLTTAAGHPNMQYLLDIGNWKMGVYTKDEDALHAYVALTVRQGLVALMIGSARNVTSATELPITGISLSFTVDDWLLDHASQEQLAKQDFGFEGNRIALGAMDLCTRFWSFPEQKTRVLARIYGRYRLTHREIHTSHKDILSEIKRAAETSDTPMQELLLIVGSPVSVALA